MNQFRILMKNIGDYPMWHGVILFIGTYNAIFVYRDMHDGNTWSMIFSFASTMFMLAYYVRDYLEPQVD